jgi:hypothetical protein
MQGKDFKKMGILSFLEGPRFFFSVFYFAVLLMVFNQCALIATRPVQEMSYTAAAIRAAKEVQADTLAPELFRQSSEWFFKAKHEYKFKNFLLAKDYAKKARRFAEQAEFEALRNGGVRSDDGGTVDPLAKDPLGNVSESGGDPSAAQGQSQSQSQPQAQPTPYDYPTPTGTPADSYGKPEKKEPAPTSPAPLPNPNPS